MISQRLILQNVRKRGLARNGIIIVRRKSAQGKRTSIFILPGVVALLTGRYPENTDQRWELKLLGLYGGSGPYGPPYCRQTKAGRWRL
jgi:hypothetical protein